MTSEGQHAGRQPVEATSGDGGARSFGDGAAGFPPDIDDARPPLARRTPSPGPASALAPGVPSADATSGSWSPGPPHAYGPPPYPEPATGSPFVVPAVPPPTPYPPTVPTPGARPVPPPAPGRASAAAPAPEPPQPSGPQPTLASNGGGALPRRGERSGQSLAEPRPWAAAEAFTPQSERSRTGLPGSGVQLPEAAGDEPGQGSRGGFRTQHLGGPQQPGPGRPGSGFGGSSGDEAGGFGRSAGDEAGGFGRSAGDEPGGFGRFEADDPGPSGLPAGDRSGFGRPTGEVPGPFDCPDAGPAPERPFGSGAPQQPGHASKAAGVAAAGRASVPVPAAQRLGAPADAKRPGFGEHRPDGAPGGEPRPEQHVSPFGGQRRPADAPSSAPPQAGGASGPPPASVVPAPALSAFPPPSTIPPVPMASVRPAGGGASGTLGERTTDRTGATEGRPEGVSAFGGQRVRVPGATLTDLPDSPSYQRRPDHGGDSASLPAQPASGFPAPAQPSGFPAQPGGGADGGRRAGDEFPARRGSGDIPQAGEGRDDEPSQRPGEPDVPMPRIPVSPAAVDGAADAAPPVPRPGGERPASASASVPRANRVLPPPNADDQPTGLAAAPRPRVYGRPTEPRAPEEHIDRRLSGGWPLSDDSVGPDGPPSGGWARPDTLAAPQSPAGGRAAVARATANARVTPPPLDGPASPPQVTGGPDGFAFDDPFRAPATGSPAVNGNHPYGEHTTDLAGRRGAHPAGVPHVDDSDPFKAPGPHRPPFTEQTSDLAGRGRATAQPDPTQPMPHGAVPGGTAVRATVTPPNPNETASWQAPPDPEQSRFDEFKPEAPEEKTEAAAPPKPVRKLPVMLAVLTAAALLVALPMSIVWLMSRPSGGTFTVNAGECVKREGDRAVRVACTDAGAFQVVSKVDTQAQCPDLGMPFVVNPTGDGRSQVLCLRQPA